MLSKRRTQSRFSLSVRMKRSAQPLPSGSRTKAGDLGVEQLVGHGQLADLGLEPTDLEIPAVRRPGLERGLTRGQEGSRQAESSAAVTPSSREISSKSSPRSSRSTALCLRLADIRWRFRQSLPAGAGPSSPA
jgi:hypothetical protein